MIHKKDIIKMAHQVFRKTKGYPDRRIMHPYREWGIGISIFAILVILGGFITVKIFISYSEVTTTSDDVVSGIPQYRENFIQDAIKLYQDKESFFTTLTESVSLSDPNKENITITTQNNANIEAGTEGDTIPSDIVVPIDLTSQ